MYTPRRGGQQEPRVGSADHRAKFNHVVRIRQLSALAAAAAGAAAATLIGFAPSCAMSTNITRALRGIRTQSVRIYNNSRRRPAL